LNEKEAIERATADAFIKLYNSEMGTSFSIVEYSDAPDIRCKDPEGNPLNFEITLTEDRPRDIQAALGRSDHKNLEALKKHLKDVEEGKASIFDSVSRLKDNVTDMILSRIQKKLAKDYGSNTALVIRDVSGVGWNWDLVTNKIVDLLDSKRNPYDKGIWIISHSKDRIFRIS